MKNKKILITITIIIAIIFAFIYTMINMSFMQVEVAYQPNPNQYSLVSAVQFGHANVFFVESDTGYIMVDAGAEGEAENLDEVFALAGVEPEQVELIVVTHGHLDHIGMLADAKELTGAEVLAHESLQDRLSSGTIENPVAATGFGKLLNFVSGIYFAFGGGDLESVSPDLLVGDVFDLSQYGVNGKIIHTPGHSQGSLTIVLDNGEALIGDLVRTDEAGVISWGMFYEDLDGLNSDLQKVISLDPNTIYLSHGEFVEFETLAQFYNETKLNQ